MFYEQKRVILSWAARKIANNKFLMNYCTRSFIKKKPGKLIRETALGIAYTKMSRSVLEG